MRALLYLTILILMLVSPDLYIPSACNALKIWYLDVVPSLFPYMVFCRLLTEQLRNSRIPPSWIVIFLGLLGGSPSGASILSVYGNALPQKILLPLVVLSGTISPAFVLHTLSRWIQEPAVCRILYFCSLLGSVSASLIIYGLVCRFPDRILYLQSLDLPEKSAESPVMQSINAVLNVGGCIVIYSVASVFVCRYSPLTSHPYLSSFTYALLEVSGGVHAICLLPDTPLRPYLFCAAISFSGFSILSQNAYYLRIFGIRMTHQLSLSLLRMVASVFALAFCQWLC